MRGHFRALSTVLLVFCLALVLAACDSSSSSSGSNSSSSDSSNSGDNHGGDVSTTISGIAAAGAPVQGGLVEVFDADGKRLDTYCIAGVDGSYTLDVEDAPAPFLIRVTAATGERLYSHAASAGSRANITPATNLVMQMALGKIDDDTPPQLDPARLNQIADVVVDLKHAFSTLYTELGVPGDFNPFDPNFSLGSPEDELFDIVEFDVGITPDGSGSVRLENKLNKTALVTVDVAAGGSVASIDDAGTAGLSTDPILEDVRDIKEKIKKYLEYLGKGNFEALAALYAPGALIDGVKSSKGILELLATHDVGGAYYATVEPEQAWVKLISKMGKYTFNLNGTPTTFSEYPEGYDGGYWVLAPIGRRGEVGSELMGYVYKDTDGTKEWACYGNGQPIDSVSVNPIREVHMLDGASSYRSGMNLSLGTDGVDEDFPEIGEEDLAFDPDDPVVFIVSMGPGIDFGTFNGQKRAPGTQYDINLTSLGSKLPAGKIEFDNGIPEEFEHGLTQFVTPDGRGADFKPYNLELPERQSLWFVTPEDTDGKLDLEAIGAAIDLEDQVLYRFIAFKEKDGNLVPAYAWVYPCYEKPIPAPTSSDFPTVTVNGVPVGEFKPQELSLPTNLDIEWKNLPGMWMRKVVYNSGEMRNPEDHSTAWTNWTKTTLDSAGTANSLDLSLYGRNQFETDIIMRWEWSW